VNWRRQADTTTTAATHGSLLLSYPTSDNEVLVGCFPSVEEMAHLSFRVLDLLDSRLVVLVAAGRTIDLLGLLLAGWTALRLDVLVVDVHGFFDLQAEGVFVGGSKK